MPYNFKKINTFLQIGLKFFILYSIISVIKQEKAFVRGFMTVEQLSDVFANIPTLETERLVLRALRVSDCFDMYEYSKRREMTKYLTWSPHPDVEYTKEYLQSVKEHYKTGLFYDWALVLKENDKMIGTCGFTRFNLPNNYAEIGYVVNSDFRGHGIAAEAARRVLEFGFDMLALNRIEARYMIGNNASRRVMEKIGMTFEGVARAAVCKNGVYHDVGTCSVLESEFDRLKQ